MPSFGEQLGDPSAVKGQDIAASDVLPELLAEALRRTVAQRRGEVRPIVRDGTGCGLKGDARRDSLSPFDLIRIKGGN